MVAVVLAGDLVVDATAAAVVIVVFAVVVRE